MKSFGSPEIPRNIRSESVKEKTPQISEQEAEKMLAELVSNPQYRFLVENPNNQQALDELPVFEALAFARHKIEEREARTSRMFLSTEIPGVSLNSESFPAIKANVDTILQNAQEIGRGGDARVVIDTSEVRELPPEICYKFALEETTHRGRNMTEVEFALHEKFYATATKRPKAHIGVPTPFYALETADHKLIAMEKLPAKSLDDLLRLGGHLPDGFDVQAFCDDLSATLDHFHKSGLYHRDMHLGNIMVVQDQKLYDEGTWGFVIDFGLSVEDSAGLEPYKRELAGSTFTYDDDYGIMGSVKSSLAQLKMRGV